MFCQRLGLSAIAIVLASSFAASGVQAQATVAGGDDTALFSAITPPNVVLMVDNSGSMNHVVWHPAYDPSASYSCNWWNDTWTYYAWPTYYFSGNNPNDNTVRSGKSYTMCGNNRQFFHDPAVMAAFTLTRWQGHYLNFYYSNEANQLYDLDGNGFLDDGTIAQQIAATNNGTFSQCLGGGSFDQYRRARVTAAKHILKDVICQVNAVGAVRFGLAKFRRAIYPDIDTGSSDPSGGFIAVPAEDYLDSSGSPNSYNLDGITQSHGDHLNDAIEALEGETWTPLSESLFQIYTYLMSRNGADLPVGANGSKIFPKYVYQTSSSGYGGSKNANKAPGDPVQLECQKNFVIIITDGEPTRDDFDVIDGNLEDGFGDFQQLIGDYNPDGETETGVIGWEGTSYLDDIAMFMQDNDFRPDLPGKQVVDTYTVGFTTSPAANTILQKTATAGNGQFYFSNNAEQLAQSIVSALTDIIQKSQGFTAATVPASRSTDGNNFYTSYFTPSTSSYWDGHLKLFDFTKAGEIRDKPIAPPPTVGACAVADPGAPATCKTGSLNLSLSGWWDAADEIPDADEASANARKLYMSDYPTPPMSIPSTPIPFLTATVDEFNLGLDLGDPAGEIARYAGLLAPPATIANLGELADSITRFARGCDFDPSFCNDRGDGQKLWDIFHSNPLVVGPPNAGIHTDSYVEFTKKYKHRKRVIYAGSNGGFLHAFNTGEWRTTPTFDVPTPPGYDRGTGAEEFGFMPYVARQRLKELPIDTAPRSYYYVDGSPQSADVWLYPSSTAQPSGTGNWNQWRTVLIGGMRQGGNVMYALDVSNPPDSANPSGIAGGPAYPEYLWEFPCEAASCDGDRAYMADSWSEAIITKVKVTIDCSGPTCGTYDRWVAIFSGGYAPEGDPNDLINYDASMGLGTSRKGRAIFMIDVTSGKVLAAKRFDPSSIQAESEMVYAIPSTPAVFDLDFDGYADVVYVGDLGGNLWKWVISDPGEDHLNGSLGSETQSRWPFLRLFHATECASPPCTNTRPKSFYFPPAGTLIHGDLYLAFATGNRSQIDYIGTQPEERNRIFVMKDLDPREKTMSPPATGSTRYNDDSSDGSIDIVDAATLSMGGSCIALIPPAIGWYIEGDDGEKFITDTAIFFGTVLTGSYVPSSVVNSCGATGTAYLWGIDILCGLGATPDPNAPPGSTPITKLPIGAGLPNEPKVSMGRLDQQQNNSCENVVVVVTSDNQAFTNQAVCAPSSGVRVRAWRDN